MAAVLPQIATAGEHFTPLDALRTAVSLTAASEGFRPSLDVDRATLRANAMRISALVPTLITALYRLHRGLEPVMPHPELPYAANYLYMLTGEEPSPEHAARHRAVPDLDHRPRVQRLDVHGARGRVHRRRSRAPRSLPPSAPFRARCTAGAPSRALDTLDAIGHPDNADAWIRNAVERGERIMGFGHPVYKTDDPRSNMLRGVAERIGPDSGLVQFAKQVERTIVDTLAELKPGRQLYANVEYLRRRGDGAQRATAGDVHADVRVEPRDRLVRQHPRAGERQPDHPARRPATSDRRRPSRFRPLAEISEAIAVTPELVEAMGRLIPQLSRSAAPPTEAELDAIVASPAAVLLIATDDDGRIVGSLTLVLFRIPTGMRAWIEDVVVDQGASRQGIGEALSREAIRRAAAVGARSVDLTSRPDREAANRLYQRIGFKKRDTNVYRYGL